MSFRIGNTAFVCPEEDATCQLCGKVAEVRPYGPRGESICFECGMKDQAMTDKQMGITLFGDDHDA